MRSSDIDKDPSNGWEAIAEEFFVVRNQIIGAKTVQQWAKYFKPGQEILDVGCGFGGSYTDDIIDRGIKIYAIDASLSSVHEYRKRYPDSLAECEAAEESSFFGKAFDGVLSVGLVFLLTKKTQIKVLQKMAAALNVGGSLLFSAPYQICDWDDRLTGRRSLSLGRDEYVGILQARGLRLVNEYTDEGKSHYFEFRKNG